MASFQLRRIDERDADILVILLKDSIPGELASAFVGDGSVFEECVTNFSVLFEEICGLVPCLHPGFVCIQAPLPPNPPGRPDVLFLRVVTCHWR